MSKSILVPLQELRFPTTCVVCLSPASKKYPIQQVFTYGRTSHTITLDVPLCDAHYTVASYKSTAEKVLGYLGIGVGILTGIAGALLLVVRWQGSGGLLLKIFMGALAGFGFFVLVWWLIAIVIAPNFADPGSKEIRRAVRIMRYLRSEQLVELSFVNEQMAQEMEKLNSSSWNNPLTT
jgi:hypothetical protein